MGWVFLEVLIVLAIAVGIVWWTMPKTPKSKGDGVNAVAATELGKEAGGDTGPKQSRDG